jgi:endogenous inhibitor of DNA gyrase (YacG/DUF329 family)
MTNLRTCPVCGRELPADDALSPHRPFCSLRCRQVDLVRWSEGKYAIVEPCDPDQDDPARFDDSAGE